MWVDVNDWDLAGKVPQRKRLEVAAFAMDRGEVTHAQWAACARAGVCTVLEGEEPERPVVNVTPEQASAYCAYVGGRLPSSEQWLAAAMGAEQRRYPWGPFGLVCRRAVFGLVDGPCARGGHSADVPGSRPDGATPDGIVDLAGNVAEWTREASGSWVARGGSFRSTLASELKSLAVEHVSTPRDDVGLRCVYGR